MDCTTDRAGHAKKDPLAAVLELLEGYDGEDLFSSEPENALPLLVGAIPVDLTLAPTSDSNAKAGPKRVRKRQKDELIYLRCRVHEFEDRLARLQNKKSRLTSPSPGLSNMSTISSSSMENEENEENEKNKPSTQPRQQPPKPSAQLAALWQKVAERQYEQRQQSEIENAKLKELLEEQIRVARSLERVLRKRANADLLTTKTQKNFTWNRVPTKQEEAALFQRMLHGLECQYEAVPATFTPERFQQRGAIFRSIQVHTTGEHACNLPEDDLGEMYVEVLDSKILLFDVHSTAAAFWQHMTGAKSTTKPLFRETVELTDDIMARSFGMEMNFGPMKGEFRGKQCVRRYQEESRTILVWSMLAEPIEISGVFMGGLLVRQHVWIELTPSSEDPEQATQLRARYLLTPDVYNDDAPDRERKVGAITDFVIHSTHGILNSSHQMIEYLLVQSMIQPNSAA